MDFDDQLQLLHRFQEKIDSSNSSNQVWSVWQNKWQAAQQNAWTLSNKHFEKRNLTNIQPTSLQMNCFRCHRWKQWCCWWNCSWSNKNNYLENTQTHTVTFVTYLMFLKRNPKLSKKLRCSKNKRWQCWHFNRLISCAIVPIFQEKQVINIPQINHR